MAVIRINAMIIWKSGYLIMLFLLIFSPIVLYLLIRLAYMSSVHQRNSYEPVKTVPASMNLTGKVSGGFSLAGSFNLSVKGQGHSSKVSLHRVQELFHRYCTTVTEPCDSIRGFGTGDGHGHGYDICMDPQYQPVRGNCIVYSFGILDDWSFDDAAQKYGCEVHSFDPSIHLEDHTRSTNHTFHNLGLWNKDVVNNQGWNLATFGTILSRLRHEQKVIDVMKVDIEGAEWPFLQQFIQTDWPKRIKQLIFEIHTPTFMDTPMTLPLYHAIYNDLTTLRNKHGYQLYQSLHENKCCGRFAMLTPGTIAKQRALCCYELFFINVNAKGI